MEQNLTGFRKSGSAIEWARSANSVTENVLDFVLGQMGDILHGNYGRDAGEISVSAGAR